MAEDEFGIVGTQQVGIFRVEDVVAEGGFAVVYRAHHTGFRANVALKCLKIPGTLSADEQKVFLAAFREEGELLFHLSSASPAVVRPLQIGVLDRVGERFVPFIALEWLEGRTLDAMVVERQERGDPPMSLDEALPLLEPVAEALAKAHRFPSPKNGHPVSIVHRDLKPENIFVADVHGERRGKVLDFGIAKVKSAATQFVGRQSTQAGGLVAFTPAYGAPEQWLPKRFGQTGPWTDVWGLALTMVEVLCGHSPIDGDQVAMMGSAIDPARRPTPNNEGARVSNEVETVFEKALAVDPKDRYHNIKDFWDALTRAAKAPRVAAPVGMAATAGNGQHTMLSAEDAPPPSQDFHIPELDAPAPKKQAPKPKAQNKPAPPAAKPQPASGSLGVGGFDPFDDMDTFETGSSSMPLALEAGMGGMNGMSGVGVTPRSIPATPAYTRSRRPSVRPRMSYKRLGRGLGFIALALAVMAADWALARVTGEPFRVGPVRALWIAGPLAIIGLFSLISHALAADE